MTKKVCARCNEIKLKEYFLVQIDKYANHQMMYSESCMDCRRRSYDNKPLWRRIKSKYERIAESRIDQDKQELQDKLWEQFECAGLDDDLETFTNSEDLDDMMGRYQEALILAMSGLQEIPEWMDPEEEYGSE